MALWKALKKNDIVTCTVREMFFMTLLSGVLGVFLTVIAVEVMR